MAPSPQPLAERAHALLVAGPPGSSALWRAVAPRLAAGGLLPRTWDLFDPLPEDPTVDGLAARLAEALVALPPPRGLLAHGSAVPIAVRAAILARPERLVLTNGPHHGLDPVLSALSALGRIPAVLAGTVLQPPVLQTWLASSAGLRRAVVNPYVMDRDTVVALSGPLVRSSEHRLALARFLYSLRAATASAPRYDGSTLLVWGDDDALYPASYADELRRFFPNGELRAIPGGRHLHPEERPWSLADMTISWMADTPTTT